MTNLEFLTTTNSSVFKLDENNKYYVRIQFIAYDASKSYIDNFNNAVYILINDELLENEDLEEFINLLDDRYDHYLDTNILETIKSTKYSYFANLNTLLDIDIDEEDIINTNQTFMNILKKTIVYKDPEAADYLYKYVIDFYANGQYDDASILMNTIFNNTISVSTSYSTCGCNQQLSSCTNSTSTNAISTGTETISYDNATCIDKYKAAMYQWLQTMLSDTEFYCHWLFIEDDNDEYTPNDVIIDKLIELLQFLLDNYDLTSLGSTSSSYCNHSSSIKCNDYDIDTNSCSNYSVVSNYIKVLNYVKADKVLENKNKIYIYGKQFAEIFPLLQF